MANSWVNSKWGKLFASVKGQKIHRAKITLFTVYHLIMRYIGRTKTMISQVPINTTLSHTFLCQSFSVFPGSPLGFGHCQQSVSGLFLLFLLFHQPVDVLLLFSLNLQFRHLFLVLYFLFF